MNIKNLNTALLALLLAFALGSCGHPDSFRLEGDIEGAPTINLRIVYTGRGGVTTAITASRDGKFHFEGASERPTLVQIFDNDYRLLARTVAANGNDVHLKFDRENPYKIKAEGNDLASRWANWLNSRADSLRAASPAERNAIIGRFVEANPSDPVGALLLATEFDSSGARAAEAARLWAVLTDEARLPNITSGYAAALDRVTSATAQAPIPAIPYMKKGGRAEIFRPAASRLSLIAITGKDEHRDSLTATLNRAMRHRAAGRFEVLELSLVPDTAEWRRSVQADSVKWTQGWIAGGISAGAVGRLGIPSLPYFIVADSAGTQLWRGADPAEAISQSISQLSCL